jgi:hypothetical protein
MSTVIRQQQKGRQDAARVVAAARSQAVEAELEPRDDLAVVSVTRYIDHSGHHQDAVGPWTVVVDGQPIDLIGLGQRVQFYVHPGTHQISVEVRPGKTQTPLTFVAAAGEVVEVTCRLELRAMRQRVLVEQRPPRGRVVGNPPAPPS